MSDQNKGLAERERDSQPGVLEHRPVDDPGIEAHVTRYHDEDPAAAARVTRQIVTCFALAPILAIAFVVIYFAVPGGLDGPTIHFGSFHAGMQHVLMGLTLGTAILLIGVGAIQWGRLVMDDTEISEERHPARSSDDDRAGAIAKLDDGIKESGISRRKIIGSSLLGALAVVTIAPLVTLADLGPWPLPSTRRRTIDRTLFHEATATEPIYLVNDITYTRIKASDVEIGQLINAEPENLKNYHGPEYQTEKAKAAIIVVRMTPQSIKVPESRADWHVGGIMCYSKICTHVGCPISLWEQQTHHLLCPCHQSTFDLGDAGKVVFGPAARALPQLPITVDQEGYLIAHRDFTVPVGPSYFERDYYPEDRGE